MRDALEGNQYEDLCRGDLEVASVLEAADRRLDTDRLTWVG
jgi:hypothetical protein